MHKSHRVDARRITCIFNGLAVGRGPQHVHMLAAPWRCHQIGRGLMQVDFTGLAVGPTFVKWVGERIFWSCRR